MSMPLEYQPSPVAGMRALFRRFEALYAGQWQNFVKEVPVADLLKYWTHELEFFFSSPDGYERINWALKNMPVRPPNAFEFKALCMQAPNRLDAAVLTVASAECDKEKKALVMGQLAILKASGREDPKAWARDIVQGVRPASSLASWKFAHAALGLVAPPMPSKQKQGTK